MVSIDWTNKVVECTTSITDLPSFKDTIRGLEDDSEGMLFPPVIIYKKVSVGSASLHAVDFINGYRLKFIGVGPFVIIGNLNADIIPTGVQIEREKSLSFVTVAGDGAVVGGGLTTTQAEQLTEINKVLVNDKEIVGNQLIIYNDDGETPLVTWNLKDKNGNSTESSVFKSERV